MNKMHHSIPNVLQTQWTFAEDVKSWSRDEVTQWWKTLGPNAKRFISMVRHRKLDGERLLKMKKKDFLDEGMESWLALSFVQWVRDLKYDSPDTVPAGELAEIIQECTPLGPFVSEYIARFVRDNPLDWTNEELEHYFRRRGLKKDAKVVRKKQVVPDNIQILITDPKISGHARDELQALFPAVDFYTWKNPNPDSWYGMFRTLWAPWIVFTIGILTISIVMLVRGSSSGSSAVVAAGAVLLALPLLVFAFCCFHPHFWRNPAF